MLLRIEMSPTGDYNLGLRAQGSRLRAQGSRKGTLVSVGRMLLLEPRALSPEPDPP